MLAAVAAALVFAATAATAAAQSPATMLEEGIYAEQTKGDLTEAIQIYQRIIDNDAANRRHVSEALFRLGSCRLKLADHQSAAAAFRELAGLYPERDDLIEQAEAQMAAFYREHPDATPLEHAVTLPDPASLMPADTIAYAEIGSPGKQVETLLRILAGTPLANPLAAMGGGQHPTTQGGGPSRGRTPAGMMAALLNPSMIKEFKKVRGMAVGVQDIQSGEQLSITGVIFPGDSDAVRGVLIAMIMGFGQPAEPIEGMQVVRLGSEAAAAMDDTVILVASPPQRLDWCIRQYKQLASEPTLATANELFASVDRQRRLQDALTVWVDCAALVEEIPEELRSEQQFLLVDLLVDLKSLKSITGRVVIDPTDPFAEIAVDLTEGHTNLAYGLIRTPNLTAGGFEAVPANAAGVASFALSEVNDAARTAAMRRALSLTGLDIGREFFANIEQVTLFAVPGVAVDPNHLIVREMGPIPMTMGLAITSRHPAQTRHLLRTGLGKVDEAIHLAFKDVPALPGSSSADVRAYVCGMEQRGGRKGERRFWGVYLGEAGRSTILSLNGGVAAAATAAVASGKNAATAGPLAPTLSKLPDDTSKLLLAHPGGILDLFGMFVAHRGIDNEQFSQAGRRVAEALGPMTVQLATRETPNRLVVWAGINDLAPLGDLFPLVMEWHRTVSEAQRAKMREQRAERERARQESQERVEARREREAAARPEVADLLGEYIGGIVDSAGRRAGDEPFHVNITFRGTSGGRAVVNLKYGGPFLKSPVTFGSMGSTQEWMIRQTRHHTGVPVSIYLKHVDGELRGAARIGGDSGERRELLLRKVEAPKTTTQPSEPKAPAGAAPQSRVQGKARSVSASASAGGGAAATVKAE